MNDTHHLSQQLITLAREHRWTLFFAESCTGGLLTSVLTDISGSSEVLMGGICSYSNSIKESLLRVHPQTLSNHGAVSFETAREMVQGAREIAQSDITVSVTGIAGPNGGTTAKPVGTVFVGILSPNINQVFHFNFNQTWTREQIRQSCVESVLRLVIASIENQTFSHDNITQIKEI